MTIRGCRCIGIGVQCRGGAGIGEECRGVHDYYRV